MAQTELMLRLIKDGKIVGYESRKPDKNVSDIVVENPGVAFDYFELGIKVGDEWWFEGDKGEHANYGKFTVIYEWCFAFSERAKCTQLAYHISQVLIDSKRIGTIHDEEGE